MLGLINVLKPPGPSSHDMVNWLRGLLGIRRIGHLGTLDPGAAGVLPICVGSATRLAEYMADWSKEYRAEALLGVKTDSQDQFGQVLQRSQSIGLCPEQIHQALQQMIGQQEQLPPMFSAVKQQGRKLYEYAREGKEIARKPREITVFQVKVRSISLDSLYPRVVFDVGVSKGAYIRTLCTDLGDKLGCGGCLNFLVRTQAGPLSIHQAWTREEIENAWKQNNTSFLLSPEVGLPNWPSFRLKPEAFTYLRHGAPIYSEYLMNSESFEGIIPETQGYLQTSAGEFLAVGKIRKDDRMGPYFQPVKVLLR